ncbi:ABC transporter substrate-binding protein [Microvirga sp. 2MCAF38]|uniref:ABC transporter substrate-binding protein n=1 Tax=Microvirga sp. 2MCAF38 TaxID=3232989 RepID=UPI003F9D2B2F
MPQLSKQRFLGWLVLATLALWSEAAVAQTRPQRIVSLNLCADQLLLALAERSQIASLSPLAKDRSISFLADRVDDIPVNSGKGETILFSGAGLVLAGTFGQQARTALLKRQGFDVLTLEPWRNLDHGRKQIREVAQRIGHPERGEALIAEIDAALARAKDIVPSGRSVLVYYRRGFVPSTDSLVSEILRHMGFALQQEKLGLRRGGVSRLESLVTTPPDYLMMDEAVGRTIDNGSALLTHPALADAVPADRRLLIAGNLMICGGPSTSAAIDAIASEVKTKVR